MAWLVELAVLRRGLAVTARVLVVRATSFEAAMIAITSRPAVASRPAIVLATPTTTVVVLSAFQELLELLPKALFELVAKLALGGKTKLVVALLLEHAIAETSKKNTLEVLGKSLQSLVAELAPTVEVLCMIRAMDQHIKPLNLQSSIGWRMISCK
jgi:hypothetical protein